jgi:hypothetical protein
MCYDTYPNHLTLATAISTARAAKYYHDLTSGGYDTWIIYGTVGLRDVPNAVKVEDRLRREILCSAGVPDNRIVCIEIINTLFEIQAVMHESWRRGIYKNLGRVVGICGEYHAPAVKIGLKCFYRPTKADIEFSVFPGSLECEPENPVEDARDIRRWRRLSFIRHVAFAITVPLYTSLLFRCHNDVGMGKDMTTRA